jgi:phosphoglycolate phosphatase
VGQLLIFDLDGTLIDSQQDLVISTNATRGHFGMPPLPPAVVQSYVGNGAATLVRRALGPDASEEQAAQALNFFLEYYRAHSLEHTRLYPGIADALRQLRDAGHTLAVLTNKPLRISRDILTALAVSPLLTAVYGGDSFPEKKPSPLGIHTLCAETGTEHAHTWMIGDSAVDIQTARNAKVAACGVAWGFQPEGFAAHPPDVIAEQPHEWLSLFQSSASLEVLSH